MGKNLTETLLGAVVIFTACFFIYLSYSSGNISSDKEGYSVIAKFREVGTLSIGSDVRIGGIKIGTVTDQNIDKETFRAAIELSLQDDIEIPRDSSASIVSDGLLGGKYVSLEPGADERPLKDGDEIQFTQDSVSLESLIAKFAFGSVNGGGNKPSSNDSGL
jgi:phospholipid/cholesterol/gamma-HCH transport system substrate-binding protein